MVVSLHPFLSGSVLSILHVLIVFSVMQIKGIELTVFAALIGAFGKAAGLALSCTLQKFTSAILILLLKPFRVGDNIILQGFEGTVTIIRILYTRVTTIDNRTDVIPNSKLSNDMIINLSREGRRRLDIELKLNFSKPFANVKAVIEKQLIQIWNYLKIRYQK